MTKLKNLTEEIALLKSKLETIEYSLKITKELNDSFKNTYDSLKNENIMLKKENVALKKAYDNMKEYMMDNDSDKK